MEQQQQPLNQPFLAQSIDALDPSESDHWITAGLIFCTQFRGSYFGLEKWREWMNLSGENTDIVMVKAAWDAIRKDIAISGSATPLSDTQPYISIGSFSWALQEIKDGQAVMRRGWNGKDMFLILGGGQTVPVSDVHNGPIINPDFLISRDIAELKISPHIDMWSAQREYVTGWAPSQTDMLADDWEHYVER